MFPSASGNEGSKGVPAIWSCCCLTIVKQLDDYIIVVITPFFS